MTDGWSLLILSVLGFIAGYGLIGQGHKVLGWIAGICSVFLLIISLLMLNLIH